jgi:hypothetical protein
LVVVLIAAVGVVVPWVPLIGSPLWDLVLRGVLVSLLFWPAAYVLGLAPEIVEMVRRIQGRMLGKNN